jgi:hypothetical protein
MKFLTFFLFLWVIFAFLDPESDRYRYIFFKAISEPDPVFIYGVRNQTFPRLQEKQDQRFPLENALTFIRSPFLILIMMET